MKSPPRRFRLAASVVLALSGACARASTEVTSDPNVALENRDTSVGPFEDPGEDATFMLEDAGSAADVRVATPDAGAVGPEDAWTVADASPDSASVDSGVPGLSDAGSGAEDAAGPQAEEDAAQPQPEEDAAQPEPDPEPPGPECVPGTYVGRFDGFITWLLFVTFPVSGDISITVSTASTGDDLVLEDGRIDGSDDEGNPITADVVGTFNCATKKLEGGRLENGLYVRSGYGEVRFQGLVTADYQSDPPSAQGTWQTVQSGGLSLEQAKGNWSATLAGP